jgi:ribonuclease HI
LTILTDYPLIRFSARQKERSHLRIVLLQVSLSLFVAPGCKIKFGVRSFREVQKLAMKLPEAQRAALAAQLLASLPKPAGVENEARAEGLGSKIELQPEPNRLRHTFKVDASYQHERKVTGIGIVIHATERRQGNGKVIEQIAELYEGIPPSLTEKFAILRALEIGRERGYTLVSVRSDYNHLRHLVKEDVQSTKQHSDEPVHNAILQNARQLKEVRFPCHPRRKNQEAHKLARKAVRELEPKPRPAILNGGVVEE